MKRLTSHLAVGLLLAAAMSAAAQTSVSTSVGGNFASFSEGASASTRRQDVAATAGLEHLFNDERGRVYYDFDGGTFDSPGDWSYYLNTAGFTYRFGGDDAAARKLYLNGSFVVRRNGDAWAAADYSALGGGLNGEFHPRAASRCARATAPTTGRSAITRRSRSSSSGASAACWPTSKRRRRSSPRSTSVRNSTTARSCSIRSS